MNSSCGATRAILLLSHSFDMNPACILPGRAEPEKTCARGAQLDAAHHTEQRGTQKSPETEMYYVCHRRDAASLACLRAATLVHHCAGRLWARRRLEPERSRGSWWSSLRWRIPRALIICFRQRWVSITMRSDTKKQPERPYTVPLYRGPPRAARTLRLQPPACPEAAGTVVNQRGCAQAGK